MSDSFLEALARPEPVPGGGAAAAHGACVGLALLEKIVLVELRRSDIPSESRWQNLLEEVRRSSTTLLRLRDEDGEAYVRFAQARMFGKGAEEILDLLKQAETTARAISFQTFWLSVNSSGRPSMEPIALLKRILASCPMVLSSIAM
jgi:formiminotetrahydrofolate cyclodeaminase